MLIESIPIANPVVDAGKGPAPPGANEATAPAAYEPSLLACDTYEPELRQRLMRRLGMVVQITTLAAPEEVWAPILLCRPSMLEQCTRRPLKERMTGSWHCLVVMEDPSPEAISRILGDGADGVLDEALPDHAILSLLRAHDRRHLRGADAVRPIGPWRIEPASRLARNVSSNRSVRLTHLEVAILRRLAQGGGATVPDGDVLRDVFGYRNGTVTHTLETHVYRMRRKLEADPTNPTLITRGPGGYRLSRAAIQRRR